MTWNLGSTQNQSFLNLGQQKEKVIFWYCPIQRKGTQTFQFKSVRKGGSKANYNLQ